MVRLITIIIICRISKDIITSFIIQLCLSNTLYRDSKQYRNLHVNEIDIDTKNDKITIEPSYEGAKTD